MSYFNYESSNGDTTMGQSLIDPCNGNVLECHEKLAYPDNPLDIQDRLQSLAFTSLEEFKGDQSAFGGDTISYDKGDNVNKTGVEWASESNDPALKETLLEYSNILLSAKDIQQLSSTDLGERRKAQNRLSQRVSRDRKERMFKAMEERIKALEAQIAQLTQERDEAVQEASWYSSEYRNLVFMYHEQGIKKKIVNETSGDTPELSFSTGTGSSNPSTAISTSSISPLPSGSEFIGFYDNLVAPHLLRADVPLPPSMSKEDQVLITATGIWDKIQSHPRSCDIDISKVQDYLSGAAKCGKAGPVYAESDVNQAIEMSLPR
ncbi:hypothetical protein CANCADRAFT_56551 [Tortispora caseinolytica NRRL Y-17796]|uniref:BZIP domain-containing protein n=1 Tax=Tortispora caseinolytica NRRL Y-17796 TaxID=767744 RepID=A0A1E4TDS5_9ASCO|nr:hypothetical protein CANCADRAFT_56551 [Tortispora caseinolytica NRRL Y-17796]